MLGEMVTRIPRNDDGDFTSATCPACGVDMSDDIGAGMRYRRVIAGTAVFEPLDWDRYDECHQLGIPYDGVFELSYDEDSSLGDYEGITCNACNADVIKIVETM